MPKLTRQEVQAFLAEAADSFPHEACLTCECFLGYVVRLRVDSDAASHDLIGEYQGERRSTHSCLGCDPCPPGDLYAEYIRKGQQPPLITLD
jgi:hypothetical protein